MKTWIEHDLVWDTCGFDVVIARVAMGEVPGSRFPFIDFPAFDKAIALELAFLPARLTGAHVRFGRKATGMTMVALAELLGVTHAAVSIWESAGDGPTRMQWSTELVLRLLFLKLAGALNEAGRLLDLRETAMAAAAPQIRVDLPLPSDLGPLMDAPPTGAPYAVASPGKGRRRAAARERPPDAPGAHGPSGPAQAGS